MVVLNSLRLKISRLAQLSNGSAEQPAIEDITTGSPCGTVCVDSADRASVAQPLRHISLCSAEHPASTKQNSQIYETVWAMGVGKILRCVISTGRSGISLKKAPQKSWCKRLINCLPRRSTAHTRSLSRLLCSMVFARRPMRS